MVNRWIIVLASFLSSALQYGIVWTVGIFNILFLEAFDATTAATALISSLNSAMCFLAGPISGALINRYGHRITAFSGGLIGSLGIALSSLATSIVYLYITFGVITGLGLGIAGLPGLSIIGLHFQGRTQSVAFALALSGVGFGMVVFPFIVQWLAFHYGWRGATLITSAIIAHTCITGLAYKAPTKTPEEQAKKKSSSKVFNLKVFRNVYFLLFLFNNMLYFLGHAIVSVHLPAHALTLQATSSSQASYLVSVIGLANIVGRIAGGLMSLTHAVSSMNVYVSSILVCSIATALVPTITSYSLMTVYAAIFGALVGCMCVKLPPVIIVILDSNLLASGYGYMLVFEAAGAFLGPPLAGWLYDVTSSYTLSFVLSGVCMCVSAVIMIPTWLATSPECRFKLFAINNTTDRVLDEQVIEANGCKSGELGGTHTPVQAARFDEAEKNHTNHLSSNGKSTEELEPRHKDLSDGFTVVSEPPNAIRSDSLTPTDCKNGDVTCKDDGFLKDGAGVATVCTATDECSMVAGTVTVA